MSRIRNWANATERRSLAVGITLCELPVIVALLAVSVYTRAPWWMVPVTVAGALLLWGWVVLVMSALEKR